jgi:hypothetical protein
MNIRVIKNLYKNSNSNHSEKERKLNEEEKEGVILLVSCQPC